MTAASWAELEPEAFGEPVRRQFGVDLTRDPCGTLDLHPELASVDGARAIADLVQTHRFRYRNEVELQDALEHVLLNSGHAVLREVRLSSRDRIDFLVGRTGIEVKVKGAAAAVQRQLQRYAHSPLLDELLLVTTTQRHLDMPADIGGKPLTVVALSGVGL